MPRPLPILRGRRFECTRCGNCCMRDGYVYVSRDELAQMAEHLGLGLAAFRDRFDVRDAPEPLRARAGWKVLEAKDGRGCPLLGADGVCSVQPVKPAQCAAFPFWPEMLDDRREWDAAKVYCEGLDRKDGRLYRREEILAIRKLERGTEPQGDR